MPVEKCEARACATEFPRGNQFGRTAGRGRHAKKGVVLRGYGVGWMVWG